MFEPTPQDIELNKWLDEKEAAFYATIVYYVRPELKALINQKLYEYEHPNGSLATELVIPSDTTISD